MTPDFHPVVPEVAPGVGVWIVSASPGHWSVSRRRPRNPVLTPETGEPGTRGRGLVRRRVDPGQNLRGQEGGEDPMESRRPRTPKVYGV